LLEGEAQLTSSGENQALHADVARLARGGALVLIAGLAGRGLLYVYEVLCSRTLGPDDYGLFGLGLTVVTVAAALARFGMDSAVVKFVPGHRANGEPGAAKGAAIFALATAGAAGLVVSIMLWASADVLAGLFRGLGGGMPVAHLIRWFAPAVPFSAVLWVGLALTRAHRTARYELLLRGLLRPGLLIALTAVFFACGYRITGAVVANVAAGAAVALAVVLVAWRSLGAFDASVKPEFHLGRWMAYAAPVAALPFLKMILLWTDTFVLAALRPAGDVGIYRACMQTAMMTSLVLAATNRMFAPMISRMNSSGRGDDLARTFPVVTRWILTFSVPVFAFLVVFPDRFCDLFKVKADPGATALVILAAAQLANCAAGSVGQLLLMAGFEKVILYNTVGVLLLNLVLNLILVPRFGIVGAAAATATGVCVDNIVKLVAARRLAGVNPFSWAMARPALAGAAAVGAAVAARFFMPGPWSAFFTGAAALAAVYGGMTLLLGFDAHDRNVLAALGLGWLCRGKDNR